MPKPTLEELKKLSVEERLQLLEDVWTSLDEDHPHPMPAPRWHEEELDRVRGERLPGRSMGGIP